MSRKIEYLKAEGREITTADLDALRSEVLALIQDRASESVLSVERLTTYRLCLSWGGPADYFELDWSADSRAWVGGCYLLQDWFDGASRPLDSDQVDQLANLFGIDPEAG